MKSRGTRPTLSEHVFQELRSAILAGRFEPGERLRLGVLSKRYDVSTAVVREALVRLANGGLAKLRPRAGYSVIELSVHDLLALTEARVSIECLTLKSAIERGDVSWEAEIVAAHHRLASVDMRRAEDESVSDEWASLHRDFHEAIVAACGNRYLLDIRRNLYDEAELYRRWSVPWSKVNRDVAGEHDHLMTAVVARDLDGAQDLLAAHIRTTTELLISARDAH